ncbi:hypothetical protein [Rhizobium sp. Leaf386]|uniref:hypothetical protein n=1 Tax=Rhizobium sp. Leaf386 TaxID=1736359 RepID=UPI0007136E9C|nr:hypothetical protein [Rhizobium sp. Leaf386]KQS96721.1 hypothetical protein ASG50_06725 [Rhizobium sp. Leaf386]
MSTKLGAIQSSEIADHLWTTARTAHDAHFAITLGALALQLEAGEQLDCVRLSQFAIGSAFVESLSSVECWGNGRFSSATRELCSQIVAGKCNRQINPFSLKGQFVRSFDGSLAWRTHLTNAGLALRLMHWKNDKRIEFANVDVKGGERIERGSEHPASTLDFCEYF